MSKEKSFNSYLLNKCLIGSGIINGIINAIIFYLLEKNNTEGFAFADILIDLAITAIILGLILTLCLYPLTKMDIKKKVFSTDHNREAMTSKLPNNKYVLGLVLGVIAAVVVVGLSAIILPLTKIAPLTMMQMVFYKGVACAIAGGVTAYFGIPKVVDQYNKGNL